MIAPDANATVVWTDPLTLNVTATEMRDALAPYYQDYYSVTPGVEKYFEDVDGNVVATDDFDIAEHFIVYNVTVSSPLGAAGTCTQNN